MDTHADDLPAGPGPSVRVLDGRKIVFDGEGFFNDFDDWSKALFRILAGERGLIQITDRHWKVVRFLREFYAYHGRAPMNRQLKEGTGMSVMELEKLFPDGLKQGAADFPGSPTPKPATEPGPENG